MKSPQTIGLGARIAIASLVLLGMVGCSLIVAHSGFATSPKRGGPSVFVPAPQAYLLAATLYVMSALALVSLVRERYRTVRAIVLTMALHVVAAVALTVSLTEKQGHPAPASSR